MATHPLDRPVWSALTSGWAKFAEGGAGALRLSPEYGPFGAAADPARPGPLSTLPFGEAGLWTMEINPTQPHQGAFASVVAPCCQMVAASILDGQASFDIVDLTDADGPEMLALATLTRPGPFSTHTHRLGRFVGVRQDGQLVAMAGERMRPTGFTEVSGVCTLPEHRGRGYAAGLMRRVAGRILARGEIPFLHSYESNTGAITLYEMLGFRKRATVIATVLKKT